jgi:hypothetical protein
MTNSSPGRAAASRARPTHEHVSTSTRGQKGRLSNYPWASRQDRYGQQSFHISVFSVFVTVGAMTSCRSVRQIARSLGVDESTVRRDVRKNPAPAQRDASNINVPVLPGAGEFRMSGGEAAKLAGPDGVAPLRAESGGRPAPSPISSAATVRVAGKRFKAGLNLLCPCHQA